jgi:hypothetical protein
MTPPENRVAKSDFTCAKRQVATGPGKFRFGMPDRVTPHFQTGWRLFKSHARVFVISMLLLFLSWVVLEIAVVVLYRFGFAIWLLLHLGWRLLFAGMLVGAHAMALKSVGGEIPRVGDLFTSLARGPAYLLALVIYCLVVSCGLVLLILPGIYLAVRYCLFAQIITDTSTSALPALQRAAALAAGNWWDLGALFLIAFLLNVGGVALLGMGLIASFPVSLLAIAGFYRSLQSATT